MFIRVYLRILPVATSAHLQIRTSAFYPQPLAITLAITLILTLTLLQVRCAIGQILRNSSNAAQLIN